MKNNKILYIFLILSLIGCWFYWTQIRPANIRKNCYLDVYVLKTNPKWAEGKIWRSVDFGDWGWNYTGSSEMARYNDCLLLKGINPSVN